MPFGSRTGLTLNATAEENGMAVYADLPLPLLTFLSSKDPLGAEAVFRAALQHSTRNRARRQR